MLRTLAILPVGGGRGEVELMSSTFDGTGLGSKVEDVFKPVGKVEDGLLKIRGLGAVEVVALKIAKRMPR